jgi:hypothetical protein
MPNFNTLMFTLNIPSSGPFLGTYSAAGQIVIDITKPSNNTSLPDREILKVERDINIINAFPQNTKFLVISYDGPEIHYYDNNGNSVDLSNPLNISKVTKIVAGISNTPPSTPSSSSNLGLILGLVFGFLFLIGIGGGAYYFYIYKSKPDGESITTKEETNNLESNTGGYFMLGE